MQRAFSLIEAMVAVAILGIFAAIAVPSLLPVIHASQLSAAADGLVGFIARGRVQAFSDRRCVQIVPLLKTATTAQAFVMRELNTHDCDGTSAHAQDIATAPRVDGPSLWVEIDRLQFDTPNVAMAFVGPHPHTNLEAGLVDLANAASTEELRFRGNGRLWTSLADTVDDGVDSDRVVIELTHTLTGQRSQIVVAGNGVVVDRTGGL
jgi:prepilin-type N-terminal cleavage/methylation domain-containing protein